MTGHAEQEDRRMLRDDMRYAAARRDDGVRKISRLTWRAGAAGVICSAVIAVAFGHHAEARPAGPARPASGTIVIPAQPPAPAQGAGQVSSGAS
ncbi:MAG: hypothetical protein ACLPN6_13010 [Streptosporangiaceae bacterium]|nr:hypothetical protein [Actinomycetota bacterium]